MTTKATDKLYGELNGGLTYAQFCARYWRTTRVDFARMVKDAATSGARPRRARIHERFSGANFHVAETTAELVRKARAAVDLPARPVPKAALTELDKMTNAMAACDYSVNVVLATMDKNDQIKRANTAMQSDWEDATDAYNKAVAYWTDSCSKQVSEWSIRMGSEDEHCAQHTGGYNSRLRKIGTWNKHDYPGTAFDVNPDVCGYAYPDRVVKRCIYANYKTPAPRRPTPVKYLALPDIVCQICPNIITATASSGGKIDIDSVIRQHTECSVSTGKAIAAERSKEDSAAQAAADAAAQAAAASAKADRELALGQRLAQKQAAAESRAKKNILVYGGIVVVALVVIVAVHRKR